MFGRRKREEEDADFNLDEDSWHQPLDTPPPATIDTLEWWKQNQVAFPHLAHIARDTFAVPATGAGVEHVFSKSGRVAAWTRFRLKPETICELMRFKEYLSRIGQPLTPMRKPTRSIEEESPVEDEEADEEEDYDDKVAMIQWEQEWWQKVNAPIRL